MSCVKLVFLFALSVCLSLVSAKRVTPWQPRIVGGYSAIKKQFPYQVSLHDKITKKHFCGGVIIDKHYILTAAHCFFEIPAESSAFYAVVDRTYNTDVGTRLDISNIVLHPEFGVREPQPDIALIRTKEAIRFSEFIKPVNLPVLERLPGTKVVISGWGISRVPRNKKEAPRFPTTLQYKQSSTLSLNQCKTEFLPLRNKDIQEWQQVVEDLSNKVVCIKNHAGSGTCAGDSGGPLVSGNTLVGLVSWAIGCEDGYPSVFVRVFPQVQWIRKEMAKMEYSLK